MENREYDIALSFAGEDRSYVEMVAESLKSKGVKVFYDLYKQADLWGKDLYTHLIDVYRSKARYTLMFCSKHYAEKLWANHERRAAQSRAFEDSSDYILPAKFDDTEIPGILPTVGFIDLRTHSPSEVAILVCEKLGIKSLQLKADQLPSPKSPRETGVAEFDYSDHNHRFRIGEGLWEIETAWSKAGDTRIHLTADGSGVRGIAVAPEGAQLSDLFDVSKLNFTSRVRTAAIGQFAVFQNTNGFYGLVQILEIDDDSRGKAKDRLKFRYWIQTDGSSDFSKAEKAP